MISMVQFHNWSNSFIIKTAAYPVQLLHDKVQQHYIRIQNMYIVTTTEGKQLRSGNRSHRNDITNEFKR